jgi:hypothetical protein
MIVEERHCRSNGIPVRISKKVASGQTGDRLLTTSSSIHRPGDYNQIAEGA